MLYSFQRVGSEWTFTGRAEVDGPQGKAHGTEHFGGRSLTPNPPTFSLEAFRFTPRDSVTPHISNLLSFFLPKICSW